MNTDNRPNYPENIIDLNQIISNIGSESVALDILKMFINRIPQNKRELLTAYHAMDIQDLRELCHKFKGSTAYCIMPNLEDSLNRLHSLIIKDPENHAAIQDSCQKVLEAFDKVNETYHQLDIEN